METILKQFDYLNDNLDLNALSEDDFSDRDTLQDAITSYIYESVQVIYYTNAIKFLSENDPSLSESIELAEEFGTPLKNINSEFLATILLQSYCLNEVSDFLDALEAAEVL